MTDSLGVEALDQQGEVLGGSLEDASGMAEGFTESLKHIGRALEATGKDVETLERGLSKGLRRAMDDLVLDGVKLSDALETVARSMIQTTYSAAMKPVTDHVGGLIAGGVDSLMQTLLPFAHGAPFSQGRVMPFAKGGVVSGPVAFPMRGGTGLMGEAGPEAIMPLSRGADGKLGVRAQGGQSVHVVMNITTPDARSFERSQGQIAAQMSRALGRAARNR